VHALNQWLDEVWSFNYADRIFTTPVISLPIVDKAIEELNWAVERGARVILVRPAPVPGFRGPRSFALPEFDPFWKRVTQTGVLVAMHSSDSGYARYAQEWEGSSTEMLPFAPDAFRMMSEWRPVTDAVASWVCHGALFRFPELKVAVIENGSAWLVPLLDQLADIHKKMPQAFPGDPVAEVRNRIHISPFWEEDLAELSAIVGVERVLFGSDYPHPEGLADPVRYVDSLTKISEPDQAKIMGGNLARLVMA
jgi:predicted TIM-barrel fold metal-dependent hydrolase